jgi:hypothetical protein
MTCDNDEIGAPYLEVKAKRSFDDVPVEVDWHDYLANVRRLGSAYQVNDLVRPLRQFATGLQYRCTVAGITSGRKYSEIRWPTVVGGTVTDGTVTWTAEALSNGSLRSTIASNTWPAVAGLTLSGAASLDLRYVTRVAGGVSGTSYDIKHQVTLASGEDKEAVIVLPVRDQ